MEVLNTNIYGLRKIAFAITAIKGVGRRYAHLVLRKADIDLTERAGELTEDEVERVITIMQNPRQYKIPDWFLNRQKDVKDGKYSQVLANGLDNKLREDLERLKKIRAHRGLRHFWGLRVRGQHTKTTGCRGRTVGVSKKKRVSGPLLLINSLYTLKRKKNRSTTTTHTHTHTTMRALLMYAIDIVYKEPWPLVL